MVPKAMHLNADERRPQRRWASRLSLPRTTSTNADEARADSHYASAIRPMASAHNAAEPRSWCRKLCTLMPMSVGRNADGHRDYHYLGLQVPMPMRLGQAANMPLAIQAHASRL